MSSPACPRCLKPTALCLCAELPDLSPRLKVIVLQHPQEPDKHLGSARLATLALKGSKLKIGLSWANLKKAVDDPQALPSRWAVLYLGSGVKSAPGTPRPKPGSLQFVDKKGAP